MKKLVWTCGSGLVVALLFVAASHAAISLDYVETWDNPADGMRGWESDGNYVPSIPVGVNNNFGQYAVEINFDSQGAGPPIPQYARVYADDDASNAFGGNFAGNEDYYLPGEGRYDVSFDFYANDYVPSQLEIYFSSDTTGREWRRVIDTSSLSLNSWTTYTIAMTYDTGWTAGPGLGWGDFVADLQDVDTIGIWVYRNTSLDAQAFGLDNWEVNFVIPEPETYAAIAVALLSLALVYRKKLNESLAGALARIRS